MRKYILTEDKELDSIEKKSIPNSSRNLLSINVRLRPSLPCGRDSFYSHLPSRLYMEVRVS